MSIIRIDCLCTGLTTKEPLTHLSLVFVWLFSNVQKRSLQVFTWNLETCPSQQRGGSNFKVEKTCLLLIHIKEKQTKAPPQMVGTPIAGSFPYGWKQGARLWLKSTTLNLISLPPTNLSTGTLLRLAETFQGLGLEQLQVMAWETGWTWWSLHP